MRTFSRVRGGPGSLLPLGVGHQEMIAEIVADPNVARFDPEIGIAAVRTTEQIEDCVAIQPVSVRRDVEDPGIQRRGENLLKILPLCIAVEPGHDEAVNGLNLVADGTFEIGHCGVTSRRRSGPPCLKCIGLSPNCLRNERLRASLEPYP